MGSWVRKVQCPDSGLVWKTPAHAAAILGIPERAVWMCLVGALPHYRGRRFVYARGYGR